MKQSGSINSCSWQPANLHVSVADDVIDFIILEQVSSPHISVFSSSDSLSKFWCRILHRLQKSASEAEPTRAIRQQSAESFSLKNTIFCCINSSKMLFVPSNSNTPETAFCSFERFRGNKKMSLWRSEDLTISRLKISWLAHRACLQRGKAF